MKVITAHHHGHAEATDAEPMFSSYTHAYGSAVATWWRKQHEKGMRARRLKNDLFIASAVELGDVLTEINGLAFQDESDDFGLLRPTFHAFRECLKVVLSLVREGELQRPSEISSDRNGDIRIAWMAEDRTTELVFPSDENAPAYVYYSSSSSYETEYNLDPKAIGKQIRWAVDGQ